MEVSATSILGLSWTTSNDCLIFRWREANFRSTTRGLGLPTKRQLLRMAMSLFDPLGLIAYVTVLARIILRDVWRNETQWDEPIPEHCRTAWEDWLWCMRGLEKLQIPRWYGDLGQEVDLHVFVDASESAMAAAVYATTEKEDGSRCVALVMAKCRVAPLRTKSIPRLELDAAVLGVQVLGLVRAAKCWRERRVWMWSDARDVLYWLRSHKRRYSAYVANRVGKILRHTNVEDWRWTPTDDNPADWATKFNPRRVGLERWWNGPQYLQLPVEQWPDSHEEPENVLETVRSLMIVTQEMNDKRIPPLESFSTWERLVRNIACVTRFMDIAKKRATRGMITEAELQTAAMVIIKEAQRSITKTELDRLSAYKDQDDVWRMRSRTVNVPQSTQHERFPVILPARHRVTHLLMDYYHRLGQHCLDSRVLNEIRRTYVMIQPRRALNRVIRQCQKCVLQKTKPLCPEMSALPSCRLGVTLRAFTYTGCDVFGPMNVTIGRRREKRWGIIFTCLTCRAVYLDLLSSLSASACMMAMDGLATRRGAPLQFHSDNGTNFVAAAKQYRDADGRRPSWIFNAPHAPHTGGAWERLIGVTKKVLSRMGLEESPQEDRLRWLLVRAEGLVNSRPLVEVAAAESTGDSITPNDLLLGGTGDPRIPADTSLVADFMAARDEAVQRFWERWTSEYLPTIAARAKWRTKITKLTAGDVVYICDGDYRYGWRKGRILETRVDEESDQVRQVVVRIADGSVYRRSASKVAPIVRGGESCGKGDC